MPDIAIQLQEVSKRYRRQRAWYGSIRDQVSTWIRRLRPGATPVDDAVWALRDVTVDIEAGESVGLIGHNGAGKSTLLKVLSRVTAPTTGSYSTRGRVGALIEVGAGFHPELSGRDNVYLNGAILGMRRKEIDAKFDRIVAFAEVEQYIDTPLKYYSSGMEVRLGFSVAAHVDPDILLVDEVLAVGDASFQAKCLNKLAELREQAKTIVLVSHNMASILQHSKKVLWMHGGRLQAYGDPDTVVSEYLRAVREKMAGNGARDGISRTMTDEDRPIRIESVTLCDPDGRARSVFETGQPACIEIRYSVLRAVPDPVFEVTINDANGYPLGGLTTRFDGIKIDTSQPDGCIRLVLHPVLFVKGDYGINVHVRDQHIHRYHDHRKHAAVMVVEGPSVATRELSGHVAYPHRWDVL
jgi:homopolymeric O-antigen transport system ATP-binding protein